MQNQQLMTLHALCPVLGQVMEGLQYLVTLQANKTGLFLE